AHATQLRVARAMVEAGVTVLVHSAQDETIPDDLLAIMAERGVTYIPTLAVLDGYSGVFGLRRETFPLEDRVGDPEAIASWAVLADLDGYQPRLGRPEMPDPVMAENLRRARDAGVTIAAGSDAGNIGTLHGPALHREMELMVAAGLSPMQTLVAATAGRATLLDEPGHGAIAPGRIANLVLLAGDPLADIRNTREIWRVVIGGKPTEPDDLLHEAGAAR